MAQRKFETAHHGPGADPSGRRSAASTESCCLSAPASRSVGRAASPMTIERQVILMKDDELIEELHRRFCYASDKGFSDRIGHLRIADLPFTEIDGAPFGAIKHLIRGDDKSGASFDIYRLGWFGGRIWELVIIDGAYLPHAHAKTHSEFFILAGRGHLSHDDDWSAYQEKTRTSVGAAIAHGFITDPEFGPTVFLSIQSAPIRKLVIDPRTHSERFDDDFVYVDAAFPLPPNLLRARRRKLAKLGRG
jgi:hypothetical protein